jgi:hypothetical protein
MFYLFSSDASPRYKRNVLDILCYPKGHIFRFRYQDKYVSEEIKSCQLSSGNEIASKNLKEFGRKGISVYAETGEPPPHRRLIFYPIREVEIVRIKLEGSIYYVDVKLGDFINYYENAHGLIGIPRFDKASENLLKIRQQIEGISYHPLPPLQENDTTREVFGKTWDKGHGKPVDYRSDLKETTQGYFLTFNKQPFQYTTREDSPNQGWESVVEILSQSPSMRSCIFYNISGFYKVRRGEEVLLKSFDDGWNTKYPLPMGQNAVLKLLFYRSEKADKILPQKLEIKTDGDAFAGFSEKEILVLSRYNEERIQIATKRIYDSVFAPISINLKESEQATPDLNILAPSPYLLTRITVSKKLLFFILLFLFIASVCLALSADMIKAIGYSWIVPNNNPAISIWIDNNASNIAAFLKPIGAFFAVWVGWLGFRRLPIGK